jgi:hypothetical protein
MGPRPEDLNNDGNGIGMTYPWNTIQWTQMVSSMMGRARGTESTRTMEDEEIDQMVRNSPAVQSFLQKVTGRWGAPRPVTTHPGGAERTEQPIETSKNVPPSSYGFSPPGVKDERPTTPRLTAEMVYRAQQVQFPEVGNKKPTMFPDRTPMQQATTEEARGHNQWCQAQFPQQYEDFAENPTTEREWNHPPRTDRREHRGRPEDGRPARTNQGMSMSITDGRKLLDGFPKVPMPPTDTNIPPWVEDCLTYIEQPFVGDLDAQIVSTYLLTFFSHCSWYKDMKMNHEDQLREAKSKPVIEFLSWLAARYTSPKTTKDFYKQMVNWKIPQGVGNVTTAIVYLRLLLKRAAVHGFIPTIENAKETLEGAFEDLAPTVTVGMQFRQFSLIMPPYKAQTAEDYLCNWCRHAATMEKQDLKKIEATILDDPRRKFTDVGEVHQPQYEPPQEEWGWQLNVNQNYNNGGRRGGARGGRNGGRGQPQGGRIPGWQYPVPHSSGQLCNNFAQGRCTWGDQCRHIHKTPPPKTGGDGARGSTRSPSRGREERRRSGSRDRSTSRNSQGSRRNRRPDGSRARTRSNSPGGRDNSVSRRAQTPNKQQVSPPLEARAALMARTPTTDPEAEHGVWKPPMESKEPKEGKKDHDGEVFALPPERGKRRTKSTEKQTETESVMTTERRP